MKKILHAIFKIAVVTYSTCGFAQASTQVDASIINQYLNPPFPPAAQFELTLKERSVANLGQFAHSALKVIADQIESSPTFKQRRTYVLDLVHSGLEKSGPDVLDSDTKSEILSQIKYLSTNPPHLKLTKDNHFAILAIQEKIAGFDITDLPTFLDLKLAGAGRPYFADAIEVVRLATDDLDKALIREKAQPLIKSKNQIDSMAKNFVGYTLVYWSRQISDEETVWFVRRMLEETIESLQGLRKTPKLTEVLNDANGNYGPTLKVIRDTALDLGRRYASREKPIVSLIDQLDKSPGWLAKNWLSYDLEVIKELLTFIKSTNCEHLLVETRNITQKATR